MTDISKMEPRDLIPVVKGQPLRSGIEIVSGSMSIHVLLSQFVIPYRDSLKKTGYQRRPENSRISKFISALKENRVDVPTSILLNLRSTEKAIRSIGEQLFLTFDVPNGGQRLLHVVDGQHRILAFKSLYDEDPNKWQNKRLQFVLMLGASEKEEISQFYTVNTTAKSVRTDLALDLLKHQADNDARVLDEIIERGQKWKLDGQAIVEELNRSSRIWHGLIRLANSDKGKSIIPAASFVTSLKPLLVGSPFFSSLSLEQRVKLLEAYWEAIRATIREPFDHESNEYSLQKGVGVSAMHDLLVFVIEHVRSSGESVFEPAAFQQIMNEVLFKIEGDNLDGEPVTGSKFWLSAKLGGAAGSYSSGAGKRLLFTKLRSHLPEMKVE